MSQLLFIAHFLLICNVQLFVARNATNYKVTLFNWMNELPTYKVDLKEYKDAINNILFYFKDFKNDMHVNAVFGLRLTSENFKHCLVNMGTRLSLADTAYINNVIDRTENLIYYYKVTHLDKLITSVKRIAVGLVATDQPWTKHMKQFDMDLFKLNVEHSMTSMPLSWKQYQAMIRENNITVPSSMLFNFCLAWLAEDTSFERTNFPYACRMPQDCMEGLLKGTDYGAGLGYRILMLVFANVCQNCHVITWEEDSKLLKKFCQLAMHEIKYLVNDNYGEPGKFLDYAFLCATQGFTQFMRRTWFHRLLELQTAHGCVRESFEQPIDVTSRKKGRMYVKGDQYQVDQCDITMTAATSATLAAAIRFILESYY